LPSLPEEEEFLVAEKFRRTGFTWLAYLMLAFFAFFLNLFGPITPFLKEDLALSYTVSSLHFTAFALGILVVGLGGHLLIQRVGRWKSLWIGAIGMSFSAILLIAGKTPLITIGASFLMGLVGSLILAVVPAALSDQFGQARDVALSEANLLSSVISSLAPLMVGWMVLLVKSWQMTLVIAAFVPILMAIGFRHVKAPIASDVSEDPSVHSKPLPFHYWLYWVALVFAVSIEFCMVFWSADFLEHSLGMFKVDAAQAVSLFLAGMIVGRLAVSRLVQRIPAVNLVTASILVAGAGFLMYWQSRAIIIGLIGLFLTGLGVASLYPLILSLAIGAANGNNVQAGARAALASGIAIFALPLVLGRLADSYGIHQAYGVVAVLLIGVFLIIILSRRLYRKELQSPEEIR
jgi:fucose permease